MSAVEGMVINPVTAAQQLAHGLSARIMAGAFPPGEKLKESAIAAELGISRATVREAVRILQLGGLVEYRVNHGAVVISPTIERVEELFIARDRLECAAATRVPTPKHINQLRASYDELSRAVADGGVDLIVPADLRFHTAIVSMLDSSRLDAFFADLTKELHFYLLAMASGEDEHESRESLVEEHLRILEAIESGSPEAAVAAVSTHLLANHEHFRELLAN